MRASLLPTYWVLWPRWRGNDALLLSVTLRIAGGNWRTVWLAVKKTLRIVSYLQFCPHLH
jgi:hypothetical protein